MLGFMEVPPKAHLFRGPVLPLDSSFGVKENLRFAYKFLSAGISTVGGGGWGEEGHSDITILKVLKYLKPIF